MRKTSDKILRLIREKKLRVYSLYTAILFALVFLFFLLSMQVTSTPKFCGTCHYMKPYFASWQTSSHNKVACVECHIPPGITSEFRKKYEALAMVARYITRTYSTNPWAEVDDESCLRCHEKRLLFGKEIFRGVLFDHAPHLTEFRKGKKLRCTSCHSQIVQGLHIAVTVSTCNLCHFKNEILGEGKSNCTLCHRVPEKIITKGNLDFNHGDVERFGMQCSWCHSHVIKGDGDVLRDRCFTCHNEPVRLSKFEDTDLLHKVHITEHKVECLSCHLEIQHKAQEELEVAMSSCETCHKTGHSPQRDLYVGIGGKGVEPTPSVMYLAGVRCEGCHFIPKGDVHKATEVSCMACHGTGYYKIYLNWKEIVSKRLSFVEGEFEKAKKLLESQPIPQSFIDAEKNIDLVSRGIGIHNVCIFR
ncbi:MAG: cytochrome c3 family protein [Acidobacteriota bacterium]